MSPAHRRWLLWLPIGLAVAAGLAVAFRPEPIPVETATVARGPLTVAVEAEGETRVREAYVVSAPITGRLMRLDLEVGDPVAAGTTVVARIRPREPDLLDPRTRRERRAAVAAAEAALRLAEAERDRAAAEIAYARTHYERVERLVARGSASPAALDRALLALRTAEAERARAEAEREVRRFELENARARMLEPAEDGPEVDGCCVHLHAPVDGVVLEILQKSESVVAAGAPVVELGDPRDLEVVVDVLSRDAVRLAEGAPVRLRDWGGEEELAGRIRRIEPRAFTEVSALGIEEQRVNVVIDLIGPPARWSRLGHGFRLDAALVVWEADDVLQVPVTALVRDGAGEAWRVYRLDRGRARATTVELGRRNDEAAVVTGGLAEGDVVVRFPSARLTDGVRVRARGPDARADGA